MECLRLFILAGLVYACVRVTPMMRGISSGPGDCRNAVRISSQKRDFVHIIDIVAA
jgi:hypothetical protein